MWVRYANVVYNGGPQRGALVANAAYEPSTAAGILFSAIAINNLGGVATSQLTNGVLYFAGSLILPTVYVFCVSTTDRSLATPFTEAPATSLKGVTC